jgi:hypothetical protein
MYNLEKENLGGKYEKDTVCDFNIGFCFESFGMRKACFVAAK